MLIRTGNVGSCEMDCRQTNARTDTCASPCKEKAKEVRNPELPAVETTHHPTSREKAKSYLGAMRRKRVRAYTSGLAQPGGVSRDARRHTEEPDASVRRLISSLVRAHSPNVFSTIDGFLTSHSACSEVVPIKLRLVDVALSIVEVRSLLFAQSDA